MKDRFRSTPATLGVLQVGPMSTNCRSRCWMGLHHNDDNNNDNNNNHCSTDDNDNTFQLMMSYLYACVTRQRTTESTVRTVTESEKSCSFEAAAALPLQIVQVDHQRQGMLPSADMHQEQSIADAVCDWHTLLGQNKQWVVGHLRAVSVKTDILHRCIKPMSAKHKACCFFWWASADELQRRWVQHRAVKEGDLSRWRPSSSATTAVSSRWLTYWVCWWRMAWAALWLWMAWNL